MRFISLLLIVPCRIGTVTPFYWRGNKFRKGDSPRGTLRERGEARTRILAFLAPKSAKKNFFSFSWHPLLISLLASEMTGKVKLDWRTGFGENAVKDMQMSEMIHSQWNRHIP